MLVDSSLPALSLVVDMPSRLAFLDETRALAILLMIATHVVNALLEPAARETPVFQHLSFGFGLVAPLFLIIAGYAVMVSLGRRAVAARSLDVARLRRYGGYVALGYFMHLPVHTIERYLRMSDAQWQAQTVIDVLHVLGISLSLLYGAWWLLRRPPRVAGLSMAIVIGVLAATPVVRTADWSGWPVWAAAYFWTSTGSLFPLFPWAAYPFVGAALAVATAHLLPGRRTLALAAAALGVLAGAAVLRAIDPAWLRGVDYWRANPAYVLVRIGAVLSIMTAISALPPLPRGAAEIVRTVAERSLLIYVFHVFVVYGRHR